MNRAERARDLGVDKLWSGPPPPSTIPQFPFTVAEWQIAVDLANAMLGLDSARQYGLVEGGPAIDVKHCERLLRLGRERGITWRGDPVDVLAQMGLTDESE